jgi:hypothetical protein
MAGILMENAKLIFSQKEPPTNVVVNTQFDIHLILKTVLEIAAQRKLTIKIN